MNLRVVIASRIYLIALFCLLVGGSSLPAAEPSTRGVLIARSAQDVLREMPLRHTEVSVEISGFVARTRVEQTFENPFDQPIEVSYVFPLGDDAAVDAFEMQIDTRIVRGEIHRREDARQIYEKARDQGFQAALLDQEQPNVFHQRIANVVPGHPIVVRIQTVEILEQTAGSYEYVFPLVVAERYDPEGDALAPPIVDPDHAECSTTDEAERRMRDGDDVTIRVWLDAGVTLRDLSSPTHDILTARGGPRAALVELAPADRIPNKDFVLRWEVGSNEPALGVLSHRDGVDGYFALLLQPKGEIAVEESTPKQIVFLLDVSGSMDGPRLAAAKAFLGRAVARLGPEDTFSLMTFADDPQRWRRAAMPTHRATIEAARRWIRDRKVRGGTELLKGLRAAAATASESDRYSMIVAITDALVSNDDQVLASLRDMLGETRLFTVGMGMAPNRSLIHRMARIGRGSFTYIPDGSESEAERALDRFFDWAGRPYLTDLEVDWGALPVLDAMPEPLPDLFNGQSLQLVGRYAGSGSGEVTVRGRLGGVYWQQSLSIDLPEVAAEHAALGSVWARRRIEELSGIRPGDPDDDAREEIVRLALEHRLMTEYTSFVAVDYTTVFETEIRPGSVEQVVPAPADAVLAAGAVGTLEHVMVTARHEVVSLQNTSQAVRFSDEFISGLPVPGRFYQNILALAPGVQDATRSGTPNVHGARARDFQAEVSGVTNVDPLTGQMMTLLNPNSIEELEVVAAGARVEFSRAQGGFARIIQKQGSNDMEGLFDLRLRSDRLDGHGADRGVGAARPGFDGQQAELQMTGPIVKDRAWYRVSHAALDRSDPVGTRQALDLSHTRAWSFSHQLTWEVAEGNRIALHLDGSSQELGNFDVSSMVRDGAASTLEHDREAYALSWTAPISTKLLVESTLAYHTGEMERRGAVEPEDCRFGAVVGQCFDGTRGETTGSIARAYGDRSRSLLATGRAKLFAGRWGGSHELQLGVELERTDYRRRTARLPDLLLASGQSSADDYGRFGGAASRVDPADAESWSIFVEDLYKPHPNVAITLGFRADHRAVDSIGRTPFDPAEELARFTESSAGLERAEREALAAQMFTGYEEIDALVESIGTTLGAALDCVGCDGFSARGRSEEPVRFRDTSYSPMLSASWDPWGTGANSFAVTARRYHGEIPVELLLLESEPATADLAVTAGPDRLSAASLVVAPNALVVDRELDTPYQDEWTLGFEREVMTETALRLRYVNRHFRRQLRYFQINHLTDEQGQPALQNPYWGDVAQLSSRGRAEYEALVLELTRRMYRAWEAHASYTYSRSRGDGEEFVSLFADDGGQTPNVRGYQSNDRRHAFKLTSAWITPWGVELAGVLSWQSGLPFSELTYQIEPATIPFALEGIAAATPRRRLGYVGYRNARRNPAFWNLDLRVEKAFHAGRGVDLLVGLDLFNLFNDRTRIVYSPLRDLGRVVDGAADARERFGRHYQIGMRIEF